MIRVTSKTMQKKIYKDKDDIHKKPAIYRVVTWWFLFIPIYSKQTFLD